MKYYSKQKYSIVFMSIVASATVLVATGYASTSIGTDIQTGGSVGLTATSSVISFANGWRISQTSATTTELTITDDASSTVVVFDEN